MNPRPIRISDSKSLANRQLIVQSFSSDFVGPETRAEDVLNLYRCLEDLKKGQRCFAVAEGGTTLRFLVARLSRLRGEFEIRVGKRLLERPHAALFEALQTLGCEIVVQDQTLLVKASGWSRSTVSVDCSTSSQFASALLLASVDHDLDLQLIGRGPSDSYLKMTIETLLKLGIVVKDHGDLIEVKKSLPEKGVDVLEPDMSSCFAIAAVASLTAPIRIKDFPVNSLQPDFSFLQIFTKMGIQWERTENDLLILPGLNFQFLAEDLADSIDLFPVLSVLIAAKGAEAELTGLANLKFKESDRMLETSQLLGSAGVLTESSEEVFRIFARKEPLSKKRILFDPRSDHRMAMAAAALKVGGATGIEITHPEVVNKSYPNFWEDVESLKV